MKPKVLIQIMIGHDDRIGVSSTSSNHVTNLGLLGVAQSMFLKGIEEKEPSSIVVPQL